MPTVPAASQTASDHYVDGRADNYLLHHQKTLRNRLTSAREVRLLYQALIDAGRPKSAIDLPCGTGRFWPAFARAGVQTLWAFDASENMLRVAASQRSGEHFPARLQPMSAFEPAIADKAVEFTACLRFYHHLAKAEDRLALLSTLSRITRGHIALSLWVDGNLGGWRRMRRQAVKGIVATPGYGRRLCRAREDVEAEFRQAGLQTVRHYDVWPGLAMWRLYLLRVPAGA